MCDVCADILEILEPRDVKNNDKSGVLLTKKEITSIILYTQLWPQQRQCMCCYTDIKNFSRFNNVIQLILAQAIQFIETLTRDCKVAMVSSMTTEEDEVDVTSLETSKPTSRDLMDGMNMDDSMDGKRNSGSDSKETWTLEEKDRLFQFVSKVFSPGFPLYLAFKHRVPTTLEELAKHDTSVLNTYCELNDPDVPLLLLRNVCYFCDSNGFKALAQCFRDSQPDTLPLSVAHTLVTICANVRMWMNYRAAARFMSMIRRQIIGYMCHFTEKDLRTTMARTMTELVWQALKDCRDLTSQTCLVTFDKEGLDLAFKYFTCSMLTLRLAGIAQINTQINMYTELAQGEGMAEVESVGTQLSDWLIENKIIEQIFGPNLHVEIIKQSQVILNFLALECRLTNDHVDVIWGASQLKHCGKQVLEILSMMVKNMDLIPAQHLHGLMQQLEPSAHTEQTIMLASALTKLLWMNISAPQNHSTLTLITRHHGNQPQVFAVATQQMSEDADLVNVTGELLKQAQFGSSRSDSDDEEEEEEDDDEDADGSGNELEMGEVKQLRHPHLHPHFSGHQLQHHRMPHLTLAASSPLKECWNETLHAKLPGHSWCKDAQGAMVRSRRFKSSSTDGQRSEEPKSDDEDDEDENSNQSDDEEEERDSRNVRKQKKLNGNKRLALKMTGLPRQRNSEKSVKKLKHNQQKHQRREEDDGDMDDEDENENENAESRIVKPNQGRNPINAGESSKTSQVKRNVQLLRAGFGTGRMLFGSKGSQVQMNKYKARRRLEVSDDEEEAKKESEDDNNADLSDSEVDMACKENKSSDDEEEEEEMGAVENDDEKEKSPSASPSSSSLGSASTCEEVRKGKRRFPNKICLSGSLQDFQGSISVGRPIAGKSRRALMMAMRLKNQKKNFADKVDGAGRISRAKYQNRAEKSEADEKEEDPSTSRDEETAAKDQDSTAKEGQLNYLQQRLNQPTEKNANQLHQIHIYHEQKFDANNQLQLPAQSLIVDQSLCNQQRAPGESNPEEHLIVMPTCRDDDVTVVTDAMLMEAYSVKEGGRMMQFDDEGNKGLTAEDLEACLDQSGAEPGVILLKSNPSIAGNLVEDILSPEGTSNSSRFTNKSEKNMSDFEGEDAISDEELANINAHSQFVGLHPMQSQLANMAPFYHHPHHHHHHHLHAHSHLQEMFHEAQVSLSNREVSNDVIKLNELCQPQNTIIWDLLQDHNIDKLQEGLALEAEKILSSLICLTSDKIMRSKFIEACISNLAQNKSVVISLRLLSKLLNSFNQYRNGPNTHYMTLWADNELKMMKHFFNNLLNYTKAFKQDMKMHNIFSHKEEVQSRLQFLTCVFSSNGSPEVFKMSTEQMDILWDCLAYDHHCSDDCLQWFYNQTKNKDYHALNMEALRHIFVEKMPLLKPEETSTIGLSLFTQLCHLAHSAGGDSSRNDNQNYGIDQLWEIALRARNTDVSLTAINVLNHHYISTLQSSVGGNALEKEESFVQKCMKSLMAASDNLYQNAETSLLVIQRALILLTNHLESFRKQNAYYLRLCQLNNQMVQSHYSGGKNLPSSLAYQHKIRIILQTAGSNAKTAIEVSPNDLVAELRAEITHWWETSHNKNVAQHSDDGNASSSGIVYGSVRLITQGQELSNQVDDKTLAEMQFKDHQLVFVSQSRVSKRINYQQLVNFLYKLPMILLTEEPHFTCLFNLLHQLSSFLPNDFDGDSQEQCSLQTKARVLSRKVWSLLMLLPSNKKMFEAFFDINEEDAHQPPKTSWRELLDPTNPHKLMYSLLIVECLSRPNKNKSKSYKVSGGTVQTSEDSHDNCPEKQWKNKFVASGGFQHLLSILLSGVLQDQDVNKQDEWQNDCLACLLRLINLFAISNCDMETYHSELFDTLESPMKKISKRRPSEKMVVPCITESLSSQMDVEALTKVLMVTMFNAAMPSREFDRLPVTFWGHVDVVRSSMSLLVSLAYSFQSMLCLLASSENFPSWLKRMTLEALEPSIRQESCQGLYRLCLGKTSEGHTGYKYLILIFNNLLPCLADACSLKPAKKLQAGLSNSYGKGHDDKEPYGPGCRDYLWLMCQLVDGIKKEDAEKSWNHCDSSTGGSCSKDESEDSTKINTGMTQLADLSEIGQSVAGRIASRGYFEKRHNTADDDGLVGLLKFCQCLLKHNPPFKTSPEGQAFLIDVFQCLFALPSPTARFLPKCKSQSSRNAAFDLLIEMVKGNVDSYIILHSLLMKQNHKDSHMPYSWDTWPHDEERSKCGYIGLTNLGATCYMATCMQHLFMIPEARRTILEAKCLETTNHGGILIELKKMFAYLLESERKAYNPYSFCKVYTMDHQPLNTGEQKDMTEFFTDLITKLEEMGPDMKSMVKSLFGGVLTNNVVSLDCPHVSRTKEEFYTVRCQVADMKNLNESLDEVTVKDMLEGDNMYTCSKCQKKVRAEKRACFCKLPSILCFNTMRYTFNMITMMKEKVNTHFSFPLKLDMSPYMEANLINRQCSSNEDRERQSTSEADDVQQTFESSNPDEGAEEPTDGTSFEYELIGVTVHTGTADAGHYYSFIRDRANKTEMGQDRWYLFNDAEVKPFDPAQLAAECFGGETTSKTYDSVTDKFMDFSFEKTHSAYMLFYERINNTTPCSSATPMKTSQTSKDPLPTPAPLLTSSSRGDDVVASFADEDESRSKYELPADLAEWIWQDNTQFLQDKSIFEHSYFSFMMQMCNSVPSTLSRSNPGIQIPLLATKLSTSFILETLIHAKEKPTMLQFIENTTKLFNSDRRCCEWFLDTMTEDDWWPQQILIRCPNQTVRQMFQRLIIHVINQLKPVHGKSSGDDDDDSDTSTNSQDDSCVNRFIRKMLAIIEQDNRLHCRYLAEYFGFLLEFAKIRDNECRFLNQINTISILVAFFMSHKQQGDYMASNEMSDDEDERDFEDIINLSDDKYCPQALDKMISLVAHLVEKSRVDHKNLHLSDKDTHALLGGRGLPFLYHQIRDAINPRQTCNLIFSLSRYNERLAANIVQMILHSLTKTGTETQPFFKLLTMLVEFTGGPSGMPLFLQHVLAKFWEVADYCPQSALEWLSAQVMRNKMAMTWALQTMDTWVEMYLMSYSNVRVRNCAAHLLVALVPSNAFRQTFKSNRSMLTSHKEQIAMSDEAIEVVHEVYGHLLKLLCKARQYVDGQGHGTSKLVPYFSVLNYCLISKNEKTMFSRYFNDLWLLFQPKLSEPQIAVNHNKQAMLIFWYHVCLDCPENIKLIVSNPSISKNIAFNYILADHEDQEVIMTNRTTLPAYYGILRMCCMQSPAFTRYLAAHQNIQWAFRNITTHPTQYTAAVDELYWLMRLMVAITPGMSEEDVKAVVQFRRNTIQLYLQLLDARSQWQTLVAVFRILLDRHEERIFVLQNNGIILMYEAFTTLHLMHYEATACHVADDINHLLVIISQMLSSARKHLPEKKGSDVKPHLTAWKDRGEFMKKLLSLLNFYTPPEMRQATIACLREMILTYQFEWIQTIVPMLVQAHASFQTNNEPVSMGPYFPRPSQKAGMAKPNRTPRPQFQMFLHASQVESKKGLDPSYDAALYEAFDPYHHLVDLLLRVAVNHQNLPDSIVRLSAMVAYEGAPLHLPYFAKLWYEIYQTESVDRKWVDVLCSCPSFVEYVDSVLTNERASLNNLHIYQFFCNFFPKVHTKALMNQNPDLVASIISSIESSGLPSENDAMTPREMDRLWTNINGDLKALQIILSVQDPKKIPASLVECFKCFQQQIFRSLQFYQMSTGHQSPRQASIPKAPPTTPVKMAADEQTPSSTPKLLQNIITGKGSSKRRRLGSKGELEELFITSSSSSSKSTGDVVPAGNKKSGSKRMRNDNDEGDDDDSDAEEYGYVTNSILDASVEERKAAEMVRDDQPSTSRAMQTPSSSSQASVLDQAGVIVKDDDDMDLSDDNEDDARSDDNDDKKSFLHAEKPPTSYSLMSKDKPSLVDSVVKNVDAVLRLIVDKVNGKDQ